MQFKRVLVISNNSFSNEDSNGRTLMNFFENYSKKYLFQFFINGEENTTFCNKSFKVSDSDALNAFFSIGRKVENNNPHKNASKNKGKKIYNNKTYFKLLLRNMVWYSKKWWSSNLNEFLKGVEPEVIFFQAGDSPFMYMIARKIVKKYNAKLIVYNSEMYILKKRLYASVKFNWLFHKVLIKLLKSEYKKITKIGSYFIYSTGFLENEYKKVYHHNGEITTIYTGSNITKIKNKKSEENTVLSYCGNLGVGRAQALKEFSDVLYKLDFNSKILVCGNFYNEEDKLLICSCPNIEYLGIVSYEDVIEIYSKSDILIHVENNNYVENLKGAFSTKIADCLKSEKPFLVYASMDFPFIEYLHKNKAAHIATCTSELENVLDKCLNDFQYRDMYIKNAKKLASKNHDININSIKIIDIINFKDDSK